MQTSRDRTLNEQFVRELLRATDPFIPNCEVPGNPVCIQPLASLTKLVFRDRETIRSLSIPQPAVVIILKGSKVMQIDDNTTLFKAGDIFLFPPHFTCDIINQPAPSGEYIALVLELSADLFDRIRQAYPEIVETAANPLAELPIDRLDFCITLSEPLADAILHLVKSTRYDECQRFVFNEHHAIEVVLLLLQSNISGLLSRSMYPNIITRIRSLIRSDLSGEWSLERLSLALNLSVSTLKRRLQEMNVSYRQLLDEERMEKAMTLLKENRDSIARVALACGYKSQSRFAARFRKYYDITPSEVRSLNSSLP